MTSRVCFLGGEILLLVLLAAPCVPQGNGERERDYDDYDYPSYGGGFNPDDDLPGGIMTDLLGNRLNPSSNGKNKTPLLGAPEGMIDIPLDYSQPETDNVIGDDNTLDNTTLGNSNSTAPPPPPTRIPFTKPPTNSSYKSKEKFNPRGMEHLYLMSNTFLQIVHRDEEMPKELVDLIEREVPQTTLDYPQLERIGKDLEKEWDTIVFHYIGLTCLVVLGLVISILTPVIGLVLCCCRCGGRCGGDYPSYDKKRDPCKRAILGTLLATLVVLLLFGLVCCFVTNARMETAIEQLPSEIEVSIQDTKIYLNNTKKEVKTLTETNYKELQRVFFYKLDRSGELIKEQLAQVSKAIAINNLSAIASSLGDIRRDLIIIRNVTIQLQEETSYLQSGLKDVAQRLRDLRSSCEKIPECLSLINTYADKLAISNTFNEFLDADIMPQLPTVQSKLKEIENLMKSDIEIEVRRGKRAFDSIARDIQSRVQNSIPDIKNKVKSTGHELKRISRRIGKAFDRVSDYNTEEYINTMRHYISEYSMYRYWYFFMLSSLLLLIILCFTMGIVFGCCGRRPDEATSCYKTTGASWLMWGVGFTFLFSAVIMFSTTMLFLLGSVSELLICDPLRDPMNSEVFDLVDSQINFSAYFPVLKDDSPQLSHIISRCHTNDSLFGVLNVHSFDQPLENLSNYREILDLNEKLAELKEHIGQSIDTNVRILSKEAKAQLLALSNTSLAQKGLWDNYTSNLEQKVLQIDLLDLAAALNETADNLPPNFGNIAVKLKNDAIFLEGLRRWLSSIRGNIRTLNETTHRLAENLKFNKTSLKVAIHDLIEQAEFAQEYLQVNGSAVVVQLVNSFTEDSLQDVDAYVNHVKNQIYNEIGKCGPMSTVYNSTTSAVCKNILYPFNGFWASTGWCFLFFLPCLCLAVKLASLYRKTEPYCGQLAESGNDKKQRRRSRECDGARIAGNHNTEPYNQQPPIINYPPPTNDWGEYPPAGGPPRYTSQPSLSPEYERPPPYYYPGPGDA